MIFRFCSPAIVHTGWDVTENQVNLIGLRSHPQGVLSIKTALIVYFNIILNLLGDPHTSLIRNRVHNFITKNLSPHSHQSSTCGMIDIV